MGKKEKYPYQFHPCEGWGLIYWRYKDSGKQDFEQDFREGFCGKWPITTPQKADVGITRNGKYWVHIVDQSRMESPGSERYRNFRIYCNEIEWLYEEDMKPL